MGFLAQLLIPLPLLLLLFALAFRCTVGSRIVNRTCSFGANVQDFSAFSTFHYDGLSCVFAGLLCGAAWLRTFFRLLDDRIAISRKRVLVYRGIVSADLNQIRIVLKLPRNVLFEFAVVAFRVQTAVLFEVVPKRLVKSSAFGTRAA